MVPTGHEPWTPYRFFSEDYCLLAPDALAQKIMAMIASIPAAIASTHPIVKFMSSSFPTPLIRGNPDSFLSRDAFAVRIST